MKQSIYFCSPSVTGFTGVPAIAGPLFIKEHQEAIKLLTPRRPHVVIIGGGKIEEKFMVFESALTTGRAEKVLLGGRLGNLALIAAQLLTQKDLLKDKKAVRRIAEETVGKATADDLDKDKDLDRLPRLVSLLGQYGDNVTLPVDVAYVDGAERRVVRLVDGRCVSLC